MAFQGASSSFPSSFTSQWAHDVFLSFRGKDTRNNFTAHLYEALDRKGIKTYIDNDLRKGENIGPELHKTIEESRISIIVLSQNYASSSWCLDELSKILECKQTKGQIVIPVFYKVDPSDVRHQKKSFGEAFVEHEERFKNDQKKMQKWRTDLTEVANLFGWHLGDRNESEFICEIIERVNSKLPTKTYFTFTQHLVGIESHEQDLKSLLNIEKTDSTYMLGIFGIGGIGKTTIAKAIYNSIYSRFEGSCFLEDIRETSIRKDGMIHLQTKLLSMILGDSSLMVNNVDQGINLIKHRFSLKRILLVLDNVDQLNQLEKLAGNRDWFSLGSRIIITTRDKHLLMAHGVDLRYQVKGLDHDKALQLFSWYAFNRDIPDRDYVEITRDAVCYTGGLPLALTVLGSSLKGKNLFFWKSKLDIYKRIPDCAIQETLRLSFDGLEASAKNIFLDIACFFKGDNVEYVKKILDSRGVNSYGDIEELKDKCFITQSCCGLLMMHDLLQEMGKEIVRQESPKEPGQRSRLWFHEDVRDVLKEATGTNKVEGILIDLPIRDIIHSSSKAFKKMKMLRILINRNARFLEEPNYLSNELRLLDWPEYPGQSFPSNFHGKNLVVLRMHYSQLEGFRRVQRWRTALREVANLSGWHLENGNESKSIHQIVEDISIRIRHQPLHVAQYPIGIESRVNKINLLLNLETNDTCMIGIYGIGGIGKTSIAKAVYNSIAHQFQGSCFLPNVRETLGRPHCLVKLQEMLLSNILGDSSLKVDSVDQGINLIKQMLFSKKVLIILDDVDQLHQLQSLCGGCDWLGSGSRIIVTSRDISLLTTSKVDRAYKVEGLDHNEALQLFSWHAFKKDKPDDDFAELTEHAIRYAGRLPLALSILGSFLHGRSVAQWRSALDSLKKNPHPDIHRILKISFDGLNDTQRDIFLDIACFFKGERVDYVNKILQGCGFFPEIGIEVLKEKSLIDVDERNTFMMHELLQEMGKEIVRQESKEPGRRSRVWFHEDARHVLEGNTGGEELEGILVDLPEKDLQICLSSKAFKKMKRLRLFINRNALFSERPDSLPDELRLIDWLEYPSQSLPSNFRGKKVVIFEMRNALFKEIDEFKNFNEMRIMELSDCKFLTKIPDLSKSPNLEELIVDKCPNLVEVHDSVGFLGKLVSLTISGCSKLRSLPRILKLTSLIVLVLEGCSKLQNFPEIGCEMGCLRSIDLRHTAVKELPSSIEDLIGLEDLNLEGCKNLMNLPSSIHLLQNLKNLSLKDCSKLFKFRSQPPMNLSISNGGDSSIACLAPRSLNLGNCIPSKSYFFRTLNWFSTLEELDLSGCDIVSTTCIKRFIGLRRLILVDCKKLEEIVGLPPNIEELNAGGCISLERFPEVSKRFGSNTCDLQGLVWVDLSGCQKLLKNMEIDVEKFSSIKGNLEDYICSIIFPGNKIPRWFSHHKHTSNTDICEIDITESSCLDGEITGMVLGAVIGMKDEPQIPLPILCNVEIINGLSSHYEAKKFHLSSSDHLWLQYHIPKFDELKGDNVRVKFQIWDSTGLAFFKSCGVHLVRRYEQKAIDQMLNPHVQGVPLEDVDVHLDVPDEAGRARAGIHQASSAPGASEAEPVLILSDEEGGDDGPLVRRHVSSQEGPSGQEVADIAKGGGPSVEERFPRTSNVPVRFADGEAGGSSFFELRQTLAATQGRLDAAFAELESIRGRLKQSKAVLEGEKANAVRLGMQNDVESFLSVKRNLQDYICSIKFPGNKIPNWFSHQKQTSNSDICEIDISEALCLDGEITGMALCAIVGLEDEPQIPLSIHCTVQIINGYSRHFEAKKFYLSGSNHLWLQYYIPKFDELKGDNVRVKFQIWDSTGLAFFKSCGVHLARRYEEKAIDQMLNSVGSMELDGIQLNKRHREGHNYDVHLEKSYCPPQKRQCGAFGIRISGTNDIQEHQSTSHNPPISKGRILTKDEERVKAPPLRSTFRGCRRGVSVGVGIGLRFKNFRRRRRTE